MTLFKTLLVLIFISFLATAQTPPPSPTSAPPSQPPFAPATSQPTKKRIGNIDPSEKEKYRTRFEAKDSRYFSFGPGFGTNLNNTSMLYSFTFGYEWEVGAQGALVSEFFGTFGDSTAMGDAAIGGKYFFSDEDSSPFLKGTFGMGAASVKDADSISGFSAKVGGGMTFFRTSTKHLEVSGTYATIFKASKAGNPGVFVLALTLLY